MYSTAGRHWGWDTEVLSVDEAVWQDSDGTVRQACAHSAVGDQRSSASVWGPEEGCLEEACGSEKLHVGL